MRLLINFTTLLIICSLTNAYATELVSSKYDGKGKRDPFTPLVTNEGRILPGAKSASENDSSVISLEGIIWDEKGNSLAIINGKLVKEKDTVFGMRILEIRKEGIKIEKQGKAITINLIKKKGEG